jgi:DNA invertase Pin-like site-specific DNA recombinase
MNRRPKIMSVDERCNISAGVRKAVTEGRYHKNKIPKNEYENIKHIYLYNIMNIKSLANKYGVNSSSMTKLLKKLGVK